MDLPWKTGEEYYELHSKALFSRYPFYHASMIGKTKEEFAAYIIGRLKLKSSDKVVDLGCGSGYMVSEISKICYSVGVSNSEACIEQCRLNYPDAKFELGNMETFSTENATHLLTMESIGYSNIQKTLENACRNLKSGGIFYVKDVFYFYNENKKQEENRLHWEEFFKYKIDNVASFIEMAYKAGFRMLEFKDLSGQVNLNMFLDSMQYHLAEFHYPHPEVSCHIAGEFIFCKQ